MNGWTIPRDLPVEAVQSGDQIDITGTWKIVAGFVECEDDECPRAGICGGVLTFTGRRDLHVDATDTFRVRIPCEPAGEKLYDRDGDEWLRVDPRWSHEGDGEPTTRAEIERHWGPVSSEPPAVAA